jgi:hypothetical protein
MFLNQCKLRFPMNVISIIKKYVPPLGQGPMQTDNRRGSADFYVCGPTQINWNEHKLCPKYTGVGMKTYKVMEICLCTNNVMPLLLSTYNLRSLNKITTFVIYVGVRQWVYDLIKTWTQKRHGSLITVTAQKIHTSIWPTQSSAKTTSHADRRLYICLSFYYATDSSRFGELF